MRTPVRTAGVTTGPGLWPAVIGRILTRQLCIELYGLPGYSLTLKGPLVEAFAAAPRDFRPTDPASGKAVVDGRFVLAGSSLEAAAPEDPWNRPSPSRAFATELHAFAWLPSLIGLGADDLVVVPELAYPTYEVGARLAGAQVVAADSLTQVGPRSPALMYLNSPSNPTGRVLGADHLRKVVEWARERGALVVSDECYLGLGWEEHPVSVLHPAVSGGDHRGLLAVHSLSKSSSMAGYRAGFVAGDADAVAELLAVRKHAGMMVPTPVQAGMVAALEDDAHQVEQRGRYARRREVLLGAVRSAGFTVEHSEAGLYLWATRGEPCRDTVAWLAVRGILVAPGDFYGTSGGQHVRIALTATDERIAAAAARLTA
jgi:succinyldiaminopimelate transaminase